MNKKEIVKHLEKFGPIIDLSNVITPNFRDKICYAFDFVGGKYVRTEYDMLSINIYFDGTYEVTNEGLPYPFLSEDDSNLLKKCFLSPNFVIVIDKDLNEMSVTGRTNSLNELENLILEYWEASHHYLQNKNAL